MEKSTLQWIFGFVVLCALIVLGAGVVVLRKQAPRFEKDGAQISEVKKEITQQGETLQGEEGAIVKATDTGFEPQTLTVENGATVLFLNNSTQPVWVASDPHPVHTQYPVGGGCIESVFDACSGVEPGSDWSFQFTQSGTWRYHDHLNPTRQGVIIVQ